MSYAFRVNVDYKILRRGLEEQLGIKIGQNLQVEHNSGPCNYILRWDQQTGCFALDIRKGCEVSLKNATTCLCDILTVGTGQSPKESDIKVEANGEWYDEVAERIIRSYLPQKALVRLKEKFDKNRKP